MIALTDRGLHCEVAKAPVTQAEFLDYLRQIDQTPPTPLVRAAGPADPVIYVSQTDAQGYCRWLAEHAGRPYRLPGMAELLALYQDDQADGFSSELWPHHHGQRRELIGGLKEVYLCEWTGETDEVFQPGGRPPHVLGVVFYPPWLRHGANATHVQAGLLASEGYSFVTFRLACDVR